MRMQVSGLSAICAVAVLAAGLASCAAEPPARGVSEGLGLYRDLGSASARIDTGAAQEMISSYRRNHGLAGVSVDPGLQRLAEAEATAMAASGRPSSADRVKAEMRAAGYRDTGADLSAGYRTLAEAFSGWRESPTHDRVMRQPGVDRIGIATAYTPHAKYRVFWVLLVAKGA